MHNIGKSEVNESVRWSLKCDNDSFHLIVLRKTVGIENHLLDSQQW